MSKIKLNFKKYCDHVLNTLRNFERFIETLALIVVGVFAIYAAYHYVMLIVLADTLIVAGMIIALRGGWELLKHFDSKR